MYHPILFRLISALLPTVTTQFCPWNFKPDHFYVSPCSVLPSTHICMQCNPVCAGSQLKH